ncbi:unnamed protein product [Anisakis simplex]|uniref:Cyclin-dependent serine/threonine-protein kinase DDB_G0292550 n=1 Tax=Anisakis simplex TaxID=6269 RepID=A0A0M3JXT5_ANISI|nr:unnamed protein product [Anisakis simplex]
MANEHIEANCLNKSLLLKVNSSKEDEEYISTLHQRIQPVRAATHNKFKTKSNKSKSKNNNNWCAANIQQRQQQQQQFQYHQINTAGCVVVDNNNRVVDTNSLLKAPSFSNDIVRLSSNSYVMLHQLQQSRANIKKQQAMNKRMSRQTRMNLLCDVDSLKEQQRDTSPSSLSTSTTSSGIDTMNKSSTDSENGCFQYVPPVNNCACEICAINDDKRWLNNNYANYYVQQAAQNHWYGCYQSTALTTAICAARHAVAYQQLCRQQKNLCDGCCYTNTYSNQTNPSTNTNSTDIQFQCNASNLDSTNIPLHENCCDNHRLPISTYGNYFMIPYEIIEPYLRFLESLYPQTIQKSQSNVDNENDHLLPPSFHPEMAQLSKPSSLPVLVNKTTSFATPYHMQCNRIRQKSFINQKITPNDCDEDNVDQRSNNTISTSSFRANQHVDRASKSDNNEDQLIAPSGCTWRQIKWHLVPYTRELDELIGYTSPHDFENFIDKM